VVFRFPENPDQSFIKRVIGLPGDRIETQGGDVSINGWPIPTCALGPYGQPNSKEMLEIVVEFLGDQAFLVARSSSLAGAIQRHGGPWTVKPNEVFVLGDNRDNSHDSRMWHAGVGGGVPASLLQGQAAFIFLGAKEDATSRFGLPVHDVHLPSMAAHLRSALDGCMAKRPSVEAATPPAP
jgi:signal peptidase I